MLGLTSLEVYNSALIITNENEKFEMSKPNERETIFLKY